MVKMVLNINMDAKCVKCGKGGAMESGYCLKCIADKIKDLPPRRPPCK